MQVEVRKQAEAAVLKLHDYISASGYPSNADNYTQKIVLFFDSLISFHKAYTICKRPTWKKRKWLCAIFDKKYVVAFEVKKIKIVAHKFIHGSMQKHV